MKVRHNIPLKARGWIDWEIISPSGSKKGHIDNLVVANAKLIMAKAIFGAAVVDRITVLKASSVLASASVIASLASPGVAQFVATFDELSFNDTLDEASLESVVDGQFSDVVSLSIYKDNISRLIITWTITFT